MERPKTTLSVVMQRRPIDNRWQSEVWEAHSVLPGQAGEGAPRLILEQGDLQQWLYPGFEVVLYRDEAEGYYLNVSGTNPRVFVRWQMEKERGVPEMLTLSYDEASRWMDGGAQVDAVGMPPEVFAWVGQFVEDHYRPVARKRIKPKSFMHPKDRARS